MTPILFIQIFFHNCIRIVSLCLDLFQLKETSNLKLLFCFEFQPKSSWIYEENQCFSIYDIWTIHFINYNHVLLLLINRESYNRKIAHNFRLGAIFTKGNEEIQAAFRFALNAHNMNESSRFKVEPIIDILDRNDPYIVTRQRKSSFILFLLKLN